MDAPIADARLLQIAGSAMGGGLAERAAGFRAGPQPGGVAGGGGGKAAGGGEVIGCHQPGTTRASARTITINKVKPSKGGRQVMSE